MAIENEVQQVCWAGRCYIFRYWASCDQWVPVNSDGALRASPVPQGVWKALAQVVKAAEAAGVKGKVCQVKHRSIQPRPGDIPLLDTDTV